MTGAVHRIIILYLLYTCTNENQACKKRMAFIVNTLFNSDPKHVYSVQKIAPYFFRRDKLIIYHNIVTK